MHLRHTQRHARLTAWLDTARSRRALLLLRVTMLAIACAAAPATARVGQNSSDEPKLILKDGCCYVPPDSPLANQAVSAPAPVQQAAVTTPAGPPTSARTPPPPPAPATITNAGDLPPHGSPPLDTVIDEMEDRGAFIDTLKGVLEGGRSPSQKPTSAGTSPASTRTHAGQAADVEQRLAHVTTTPSWKFLEALSLAFALGIGAAAFYFYTRRGSAVPD